jgi:hypothetical protein
MAGNGLRQDSLRAAGGGPLFGSGRTTEKGAAWGSVFFVHRNLFFGGNVLQHHAILISVKAVLS